MENTTEKYKSVLVIDDHKMIANGINLLIGPMFEHFYMAHDGASGINMALRHFPQLIVLDYTLPDTSGHLLARELKYKLHDTKILGYSFTYSQEAIVNFFRAGINGYVVKKEDDEEFVKAIHYLLNGKDYFCKEARIHLMNKFSDPDNAEDNMKHIVANTKFSTKEIELIRLLCKQLTTKEISLHINLSLRTVEQYRSNIIRKINAKNLAGVIKFALQNGIISLEDL